MKASDKPIIIEERYNASVQKVWDALTNIDRMRLWYFPNIPDFVPEEGFTTQFNVESGGRDFLHIWRVTEVIPLQLIKYSWEFVGYPGRSTSSFLLFNDNQSTLLRLVVEVQEDFPEFIPEFRRESCIGGWEYFLKGNLKIFLEK